MDGEVLELFPSEDNYEEELNKHVISALEEMLELAKEKKAINCAVVIVNKNKAINYTYSNLTYAVTMCGGIEYLKKMLLEDDEDDEK